MSHYIDINKYWKSSWMHPISYFTINNISLISSVTDRWNKKNQLYTSWSEWSIVLLCACVCVNAELQCNESDFQSDLQSDLRGRSTDGSSRSSSETRWGSVIVPSAVHVSGHGSAGVSQAELGAQGSKGASVGSWLRFLVAFAPWCRPSVCRHKQSGHCDGALENLCRALLDGSLFKEGLSAVSQQPRALRLQQVLVYVELCSLISKSAMYV